jgi:phenylacetate-CoA ligase
MTRERRIHDPSYELATRDEIRALQLQRLRELLRTASANPFYRQRWRGIDVEEIDSLEKFSARIPTVEKRDFVADAQEHPPFGSRLAAGLAQGEAVELYTTSGTSGQGVEIHAQSPRERAAMQEMFGFLFHWAGLAPGDVVALTMPMTMLGGGRVEWHGASGYGLVQLAIGNYDAGRKLELIRQFRPRALFGSTSYFGHLASVSEGPAPGLGIDVLITGAEGVGFAYLQGLEEAWGARVADRFGCTQMASDFMFTCEEGIGTPERRGMLHNLDPFVLTEVLDPETGRHVADGEFGELVLTCLYHVDNPVIRVRTRDGAVWHEPGYCACGRPFGGIEVASGARTDDVVKVKGVFVYPQAVDDVLFSFPAVEEYRVELTTDATMADVATVYLRLRQPAAGVEGEVAAALHRRMGINFGVAAAEDIAFSEYKARRWIDRRKR